MSPGFPFYFAVPNGLPVEQREAVPHDLGVNFPHTAGRKVELARVEPRYRLYRVVSE